MNIHIHINDFVKIVTSRRRMLLGAVVLLFAMVSAAIAEPKRVLLLRSYGRDYVPWYVENFRSELNRLSPTPVDLHEASLATARFAEGQEEGPFVDYLRALFSVRPLDLVVTVSAPAADFFQRHRQQLLPSTPMLFAFVEQRRVQFTRLTANDAVVTMSIDLAGAVENILRVLPDTSNIAIVLGNSSLEKYWAEQIRDAVQPFTNRVAFTWFNDLPFDQILKRAATLPPRSAIFFVLMSVDAAGVTHEESKALLRIRAVANAPIFSYVDAYFGQGIVGGPLITVADVSRQAADVTVRILSGEAPGVIKTTPIGFGTPKFDWRELQRWNISENRLPPRSEIHFRPPTIWEQYRWQMIVIFIALLAQALLIAGLLFQRHRRQEAELKLRGRVLEVVHLNRSAVAGALSASISHELNQPLGAILSNAEAAELLLTADTLDLDQLKGILADIRHADERAGEIIRHLRVLLKRAEIEVEQFNLNDVIRDALHILGPEAMRRGVAISDREVNGNPLVRGDRVHLEQVLLNLAMNGMDAMLNCEPGRRTLGLRTASIENSEIMVSISDNGTGIPDDKLKDIFETFYTTKSHGTGLGLSIARTIVENYGGKIWAENRPGGGAVIRFTLPLFKAHAA
jgi:signal transduction histidine kinase